MMNTWDMTPYFAAVTERCLASFKDEKSPEPYALLTQLFEIEGMPMHCPVHHYMIPALLLTLSRKEQGHDEEVLRRDLAEALKRGQNVLGGFCGYYGSCGAAVGLGIFWSIITDTSPLSVKTWSYGNRATGQALIDMAEHGGPRCCKRTSFVALESALPQVNEVLKLNLTWPGKIVCTYYEQNRECLKERCLYYPPAEAPRT